MHRICGAEPDGQIVTDRVWHELAFGLESLGYGREEMRRRIAEMSEYLGISGWYEKRRMNCRVVKNRY